jgi:transposase
MSTTPKFTDWREARRFRAVELSHKGWSLTRIAKALGVTVSAVCQWFKKTRAQGEEALKSQPIPGRTPRLTAEQGAELLRLLKQGAEAHGFHGDVWTSQRVSVLIATHFHLTLGERQVRRLLHRMKWSRQKPERRADQRDEDAIRRWMRKRWPALKELAKKYHRTILFVDETGVYLLPAVVKTWAPEGETPILHQHLTNAHLSVISAVSPEGALYFQMQSEAYKSVSVISFLNALHKMLPDEKLMIIWDQATIHHSKEITTFLAQGAYEWLWLVKLPGYAPDLNPDEGIWRYLKYVELRNTASKTLTLLETLVTKALEHIGTMVNIVKSTFKEAGLA